MNSWEKIKAYLEEHNEDALLLEGLDEALIGVAEHGPQMPTAMYSRTKCIEILMRDNDWDDERALQWFVVNTQGGWAGKATPCFAILADEMDEGALAG